MLEVWLQAVIAERARILTRVAPVPEPHIDSVKAKEDVYAAAAAMLSWERHTGTNFDNDGFLEAVLAAMKETKDADA
jgi:hypothetical protein